jgi:hypothetical protein
LQLANVEQVEILIDYVNYILYNYTFGNNFTHGAQVLRSAVLETTSAMASFFTDFGDILAYNLTAIGVLNQTESNDINCETIIANNTESIIP